MKNFLLLFGIFICFVSTPTWVYADTIVESVFSDRTWAPEDGTYTIRGIAQVRGATLTILPGTRIEYEDGAQLRVLSGGKIIARGEAANHIIFTKQSPPPESPEGASSAGEDIGFYFEGQSSESVVSGEFSYVDFSGMDYALMINNYGTVTVDHGTFADMTLYPLHSVTGTLSVTNSAFSSSPLAGFIQGGAFMHTDNTFTTDIPGWHLSVNLLPEQTVAIDNTDGVYELVSAQVARTATLSIGPGVTIHDSQRTAEGLFNIQGTLNITGTSGNAVTLYGDGNCSTHHPVIKYYRWWGYIPAPPPPSITIEHAHFRDLCGGIYGTHGSLSIKDTVFENVASIAVSVEYADRVAVHTSEFKNGTTALSITGIPATISNNSLHGNAVGMVASSMPGLNVSSNWWGSVNGPTIVGNSGGDGQGITASSSDGLIYSPWLTADPFAEPVPEPEPDPPNPRDPVIIIPGIMGSYLFKEYGDEGEIWPNKNSLIPSITDEFLSELALSTDGMEQVQFPIRVGDIVRSITIPSVYESDVFKSMIELFEYNGYVEGVDLFVFPYDWRKSNTDTAVLLKQKIDAVLEQSGKEKVNLIAHSMGGLVAKKYIADNGQGAVDKVFFIGTPHLGAPKAFKALMYGDTMGIGFSVSGINIPILNGDRIKTIGQNMPAIFELLPSKKYVDGVVGTKYVTDATNGTPTVLDYNKTAALLVSSGRNAGLFPSAETLHGDIDSLDLSGNNIYNFVGCGTTKTIGSMTIKKKKFLSEDFSINFTNGDGTVPVLSAVGQYGHNYFVKGTSHGELPSALGLGYVILAALADIEPSHFETISTNSNSCKVSGTVVSKHSPVDMHVYDAGGHHTGPTDEGIEYGIPGVSYEQIGETAYAFLPEGQEYRIENHATGTGVYDFIAETVNGEDQSTGALYWNNVAIDSVDYTSSVIISDDNSFELNEDKNGDGTFDSTIAPSTTPPDERGANQGRRTVRKVEVPVSPLNTPVPLVQKVPVERAPITSMQKNSLKSDHISLPTESQKSEVLFMIQEDKAISAEPVHSFRERIYSFAKGVLATIVGFITKLFIL